MAVGKSYKGMTIRVAVGKYAEMDTLTAIIHLTSYHSKSVNLSLIQKDQKKESRLLTDQRSTFDQARLFGRVKRTRALVPE